MLNAVLVIAKNKLSYPSPSPPMSSGVLFSCSLSQENCGFHVSVIDPCQSSAAWWHAAVLSLVSICPSYEKKVDFLTFHPKPPKPAGLHLARWRPGDTSQHLCVGCIPLKCLVESWQSSPSSGGWLGCSWALTSGSCCEIAGSPRVLLLQSRSWRAKGDLLTWPLSYRIGDVQQEWPEVFQQALRSEGTIWRLANKVTQKKV